MTFKLSEFKLISWPEKKDSREKPYQINDGFNQCLDAIAEIEVGVDIEELAKFLFHYRTKKICGDKPATWSINKWEHCSEKVQKEYLDKAKSIAAQLPLLLKSEG